MNEDEQMSWRDLEDYNNCAINSDNGEAVAFFLNEDDCDKFIEMYNSDPQGGHNAVHKGEYIDSDTTIQIQGS